MSTRSTPKGYINSMRIPGVLSSLNILNFSDLEPKIILRLFLPQHEIAATFF